VKFSFQILVRNQIHLSCVPTTKQELKLVTLRSDLKTLISPAFWNWEGAEKRKSCLANRNSIGLIYRLFCFSLTGASYEESDSTLNRESCSLGGGNLQSYANIASDIFMTPIKSPIWYILK